MASASETTVTPANGAPGVDRRGAKRPLTNVITGPGRPGTAKLDTALRATAAGGAGTNGVPAMGATFVNRHSSSFVVGNPSFPNAAADARRMSRSHVGSCLREASTRS